MPKNKLSDDQELVRIFLNQLNKHCIDSYLRNRYMKTRVKSWTSWIVPQVEAFNMPRLPTNMKGLIKEIGTYSKFYDNQLSFGTAEALFNARYGSKKNILNENLVPLMDEAKLNIIDYVLYISVPLRKGQSITIN